jgi:hypothetical protein
MRAELDRSISVRVPREYAEALAKKAAENDRTVSGEIRYAIKRYLRQKGMVR